jgi:Protein of unknown function (DUF2442)
MRKKSSTEKDIAPGIVCTAPFRVTKVNALSNYRLEVDFVDGTHGMVEMHNLIMSHEAGVFKKLKDVTLFHQVTLQYGAVTWPGEIDLAPDRMHEVIKEKGIWVL